MTLICLSKRERERETERERERERQRARATPVRRLQVVCRCQAGLGSLCHGTRRQELQDGREKEEVLAQRVFEGVTNEAQAEALRTVGK